MVNVYNGGVPQAGKNLYPSATGDESVVKPDNGPQDASYSMTGPASTADKSEGGAQAIDTKGYDPEGEERAGKMIMRDLNDVSHDA